MAARFETPDGVRRLNLVADYLYQHGASSSVEIGALLGIAPRTSLVYLRSLRSDGRAHRRAGSQLWAPGPDQAWIDAERRQPDTHLAQRSFAYRQTGRAQRDYLVAALFGPAPADAAAASPALA